MKNTALDETVHTYWKDTGMTTETTPTEVPSITTLPPASETKKSRNPFIKKSDTAPADATETPAPKASKVPHGVYTAGVLLLVGGAIGAFASKLGKKTENLEGDSSDNTDVA